MPKGEENMPWSSEEEENTWTSEEKIVVIASKEITVDPSEDFVSTIKRLARENGIGKFVVKVNGREISPDEAPETFEELEESVVRIEPVDEAGY